MKKLLFALALATASAACGKPNTSNVLQHEVTAAAKFYAPQLDALDARVQAIFKRGSTIPASTPGIDAVGARLTEARDMISQLRNIVAPAADGKSAVEKQAADAVKDGRHRDLEKLVHDTHTALERGITVIESNLQSVEGWIAYYDRKALAVAIAQPGAGGQAPAPSTTGQPPPASGGPAVEGGAAPAPAGGAAPAPAGADAPAPAGAAPAGAQQPAPATPPARP